MVSQRCVSQGDTVNADEASTSIFLLEQAVSDGSPINVLPNPRPDSSLKPRLLESTKAVCLFALSCFVVFRERGFTRAARCCDPARQRLLHVSIQEQAKVCKPHGVSTQVPDGRVIPQSHTETCRWRMWIEENGWVRLRDLLG